MATESSFPAERRELHVVRQEFLLLSQHLPMFERLGVASVVVSHVGGIVHDPRLGHAEQPQNELISG